MNLIISPVKNPDRNKEADVYEVQQDISLKYLNYKIIIVPKFFQFDGASIPPVFWRFIGTPFTPRFMIAAVFHDWSYHIHPMSKTLVDRMFYELLLENNVNPFIAKLMKLAVELFGSKYWKNDKSDIEYLQRLRTRIIKDNRNPFFYGLNLNFLIGENHD